MTRHILSFASAACLLVLLPAVDGLAVELPVRKAGLWEMKMARTGGSVQDVTMQHCTDASTDKQMSTSFSPGKETCSKQDIQKTAAGYVSDSVCSVAGMTITSHAEITGDFNSAYTVKSTSRSEGALSGTPRDSTTTIEAKWVGACKEDQKPGDIVMPGGMKMNILELDKLKAMMPKGMQK
jgi:predicted secreted protein